MVDVGIFGQVIDIFGAKESFMCHRAIFPVVAAEDLGGISYLEVMIVQAVRKIFVLSVVVEQGGETADPFQNGDRYHPESGIDER